MNNELQVVANPMASNGQAPVSVAAMTEQKRAESEVNAAAVIAKRFPRDEAESARKILNACQRPTLANSAIYTYARGGTNITGPSIRLAEAMAMAWGNIRYGMRELSNTNGVSEVEAYAIDLETNTEVAKQFTVPHVRHTKQGKTLLTDPRDIYELVANNGARRTRACILAIIPGDITEAAVEQCEQTSRAKADTSPVGIKRMLEVFEPFGVGKAQIEKRIQRNIDAITAAQMVDLGKVRNSLKDGMSAPGDWFEFETQGEGSRTQSLKDKLKGPEAAKVNVAEIAQPVAMPAQVKNDLLDDAFAMEGGE